MFNFNPKKAGNLLAASLCAATVFTGCSDKNEDGPTGNGDGKDFQVAFASGSGSISGTYLQGISDLSQGEITFSGKGYLIDEGRTSRIFPSSDGKTIYSLTYLQNTIDKFSYNGGDSYTKIKRFSAAPVLNNGNNPLRFTKLDDKVASVHVAYSTPQYADENKTQYTKHKITAKIGILDLQGMSFGDKFNDNIDIVLPADLAAAGYNITRIDCPVVSNGKIYYGVAVNKFNPATSKNPATSDKTFTLVLDYPSLTNATVLTRDDVAGGTNGFRTPTQHFDKDGNILQMVSGNDHVQILKIKDGQYDLSFKVNVTGTLGKTGGSVGWFYDAESGIGYVPYEDYATEKVQIGVSPDGSPQYSSWWRLARVDFKNNTVTDLTVPDKLWMRQYQYAIVRDGKFYIALAPVGEPGNIYIFDVNSTSKDGTKGAKITSGADQYYIGIY